MKQERADEDNGNKMATKVQKNNPESNLSDAIKSSSENCEMLLIHFPSLTCGALPVCHDPLNFQS